MSKHVVFVLDTSGSMSGKKIHQTKNAMKTILSELREQDSLTIIEFDDNIKVWTQSNGDRWMESQVDGQLETARKQVFQATRRNIADAIAQVESLQADGGTNINDALMKALSIIGEMRKQETAEQQYMIIFLTDGHVSYNFYCPSTYLTIFFK